MRGLEGEMDKGIVLEECNKVDTINMYFQPEYTRGRLVCCIGDIHGYIDKLHSLWTNLEFQIGSSDFRTALIIFLGDYCDRGPETRSVIDFLISLPSNYPHQSHVFLSGNHDFAFAAFVGVLPRPPNGSSLSETWKEYAENEEREGWFLGDGFENMHVQGRRWGGSIRLKENPERGTVYQGSVYDSRPTFEAYGVPHGSVDLIKAVPEAHKKFLANMVWVHEEEDVCINCIEGPKHCKLIAVHAGLESGMEVEKQIKLLKEKDTRISKVPNLSGRANVWDIPEELLGKKTIVISGHHGKVHIEGLRMIIDEGAGLKNNSIAAIIFPSMNIVRDTVTATSHI